MIEALEDIIEELANKLRIYGAHGPACRPWHLCRCCWTSYMRSRIDDAVEIEKRLAR